MRYNAILGLALACLLLPATAVLADNNPVGLWVGFAFDDDSENFDTSGRDDNFICFLADGSYFNIGGTPGHGHWFQKGAGDVDGKRGDLVRVAGHWDSSFIVPGSGGNQAGEFRFIHDDLMAGAATEWIDDGTGEIFLEIGGQKALLWGTLELRRVGDCTEADRP